VLLQMALATLQAGDLILVLSEHGHEAPLSRVAGHVRERRGKVVTVTRNTANPLRAHANFALLISAHDERPHVKALVYESQRQQLLDLVYVLLCSMGRSRHQAATEPDAN
jgi:DNA-binding MurR/RpiR family transcriptional regulator